MSKEVSKDIRRGSKNPSIDCFFHSQEKRIPVL